MTLHSPPGEPIGLDPQRLYLELLPLAEPTPDFSTPGARRRAYLNQVGLTAFLAWLQAERVPTAQVWPSARALPSFWEVVNGTAIDAGPQRFVIIPTEAIDASELRVPQEWVDISTWAADYYVLLQVNADEEWVGVIGYATHHTVKTQGQYDADDRAYSLDSDQLITDINIVWLAQQFCPNEPIRAELAPLELLEQSQAQNLLNRLGNATVTFPRWEIPFSLWGSLLAHGGWRQRLYEQRQGYAEQWSMQQWLQGGLSQLAKQFGWGLELAPVPVMTGMRSAEAAAIAYLTRPLVITGHAYELRIVPQGEVADRVWRFTLASSDPDRLVPPGLTLRLLTEDLQPFENNSDTATTATTALYIEVMLEPAEGIVWEVDPLPEGYDREILRF